jgi:uncharacterized OsmC-like protein
MRNNVSTAGFSELAHEFKDDPEEAIYRYRGIASHSARRGLSASIGPALLGRVKSARAFSFNLCDSTVPADDPTPLDLALTGIATCSLKTLIGGGTARGVIYDVVGMLIRSGSDLDRPLVYNFEIGGDFQDATITELLERVRHHSPNHRTISDSISITIKLINHSDRVVHEQTIRPSGDSISLPVMSRSVRWVTGLQFESSPLAPRAGQVLRVDSPRQLTGVDWGPNAQEYLLMALASDLAAKTAEHSRELLGEPAELEVIADGHTDLRGMFSVDPLSYVALQDITCTIRVPDPLVTSHAVPQLIAAAMDSRMINLIRNPQNIEMTWTRPAP